MTQRLHHLTFRWWLNYLSVRSTLTLVIRILSDQTINQIKAGEVVDRPSSVVKELIENSLDSGASRIDVRLRGGGQQLIEVCDDGCGMGRQDALLCFERHATSKIEEIDDLKGVSTLGFRGEALASIASVAKVELVTSDGEEGSRVVIEGGAVRSHGPAGRSKGTTLFVRSLFYNAPARRKFQKSTTAEVSEIRKVICGIALAYPEVEFSLHSGETTLLQLLPSTAQGRLDELLGEGEWAQLDWAGEGISIQGFLSRPSHHRANRTGHHLYINQRMCVSSLVSRAVTEGYGTRLPTHRYPLFVLHLNLPGSEIDVNVHPQKREVRFHNEALLGESIYNAVSEALQESTVAPPMVVRSLPQAATAPLERSTAPPPPRPVAQQATFSFRIDPIAALGRWVLYDGRRLPPKLANRFGAVDGGLVVANLVAVRGRLLFEQMSKGATQPQPLLIPQTLDLSAFDAERLESALDKLVSSGFSIRSLGGRSFLIDALPCDGGGNIERLLFDSIDHIDQYGEGKELAKLAARRAAHLPPSSLAAAGSSVEAVLELDHPWEGACGEPLFALLSEEKIGDLF